MGPAWLALTASLVLAQTPPKSIASPTWKTVQVSPELASFFADAMAGALRKHGFRVVTASEIESLLSGERQKQLMGCGEDSASCIAELAAALGCDATLLVNLAKLDATYRGNLKVLSSVNGEVLAEVQVEAGSDSALAAQLEAAAARLAQGLDPKRQHAPAAAVRSSGGTKRFWLVPAIGGAVFVIAGVGSFAYSESSYGKLAAQVQQGKAIDEGEVRTGALVQTMGCVGVGIGAAALVTAGALWLFGSEPSVTPVVAFGPSGASVGFAGAFP